MKFMREAVYHRPVDNWCYGYGEDSVHVRLRTKRNDSLSIDIVFGDKCRPWAEMTSKTMDLLSSDEYFDYWQVEVTPAYGRLAYGFLLKEEDEEMWFTERGLHQQPPTEHLGLFELPYLHPSDTHQPPAWVKEAVFYQIFPERFANGDPSNDPEHVLDWGGTPQYFNFFGGDLKGVLENLDHLSELGINAIYFTPLFEAPSNHKYDTTDYFRIDPHFGTTEDLRTLVDACHERGIRVILDGVFNHSGITFPPFQDVVAKGKESRYFDWFHIKEWPLEVKDGISNYKTFAFERTMPKLNTSNPEVRDYFVQLGRHWIQETGIDGWRLDVANETDHELWREFRKGVKDAKPDAYILGEVWHDGMKWLRGDQFDGVMNYPVSHAILDFFVFGHLDADIFSSRIGHYLARYPQQANEACFNHLDTHDTVRLLTLCKGDKDKMKQAVLFQFMYVGAPSIYYGDEIGLAGEFDPDNRRCMIWDQGQQDRELYDFYRTLIRLRHKYKALTTGSLTFRAAEPGSSVLAFERCLEEEVMLIVMNAGEEAAVANGPAAHGIWRDLLTGEQHEVREGMLTEELGPRQFRIWTRVANEQN